MDNSSYKDRNFASSLMRSETFRGFTVIALPLLTMTALLGIPLTSLLAVSFWQNSGVGASFTLDNYKTVLNYRDAPVYIHLIARSISISAISTVVILLITYPVAYFLAFSTGRRRFIWIILITVPFWTSYLLRIFAWKIILGFEGVINATLKWLGLIEQPLQVLLYNPVSVTITLSHAWAAYAILPIYVSLEKIDRSLLEAAVDLGDTPMRRFFRVTLPLSMPGTIAAALLVFIPTVGDYVTPALVGGTSGMMVGNMIQTLVVKADNAPLGAALSVVTMMTVILLVCVLILSLRFRHGGVAK